MRMYSKGRIARGAASAAFALVWFGAAVAVVVAAVKSSLWHHLLWGSLRGLLSSTAIAAAIPWLLSTRQGTAAVSWLLTACLPGRVEIDALQLSWTSPAVLTGVRVFETHHPVARPLLELRCTAASAPPLAFVRHLLLSLRPTPGPHPGPPPAISITGLTVDGTFCLTHHQPRILTFLRLTGVLSMLSALVAPTPPSAPAHPPQPCDPPIPPSKQPQHTTNATAAPQPHASPASPLTSPTFPPTSPTTSTSARSCDPAQPLQIAVPSALQPSPDCTPHTMPPSPFWPQPTGPAATAPPAAPPLGQLKRASAFREPKPGNALAPMASAGPATTTPNRLAAAKSNLKRSRAVRVSDHDLAGGPPPASPPSAAPPGAGALGLSGTHEPTANRPRVPGSPSTPPPSLLEPSYSAPMLAPLPPLASEPLPSDGPPGRTRPRWFTHLLPGRRKGPASHGGALPSSPSPSAPASGPPWAAAPDPLRPTSSSPLEPLPSWEAPGTAGTHTSMYRWWGIRLSNAQTGSVDLRADVWLPFCQITVRDSVLQVPADVMDVAGARMHLQAAVGLQPLQDAAADLKLDVSWASQSRPPPLATPTHATGAAAPAAADPAPSAPAPAAAAAAADAAGAALERAGSTHGWWMPPFVARMHSDYLDCHACGWVAPRSLQLLLHRPMVCDIDLHPRLGSYALNFFNPGDQRGVGIATTKLRTAFSPAAMQLPCPAGGTLEVVHTQLELERGLAFVQLLEKLVVRGLVEQLADAQTVTVWLSPRPIRLAAWEKLLIPRQDMYIRTGRVELHLAVWGKLDLLTRTLDIRLALVAAGMARRRPLYTSVLYFNGLCRAHDAVPDLGMRHCPLTEQEVGVVLAEWGAASGVGAGGGDSGVGVGLTRRRRTDVADGNGTGPEGSSGEEGGALSEGGGLSRRTRAHGKDKKKRPKFLWEHRVQGRPEDISLHLVSLGTFLTKYFAASALKGAVIGVGKSIAGVLPSHK